MPKYFCSLSSLWFDGLMAPDLSSGLATPFVCGLWVLGAASILGGPLAFGAVSPVVLWSGSCMLVRFKNENLLFSCFEGFGDSWLIGLGDLAVINAGLGELPVTCTFPESHVAEVFGRSNPGGADAAKAASSRANVSSKPVKCRSGTNLLN
jgi:hypothetical protein